MFLFPNQEEAPGNEERHRATSFAINVILCSKGELETCRLPVLKRELPSQEARASGLRGYCRDRAESRNRERRKRSWEEGRRQGRQ